ncbi:MAG: UvrD-helicase domain-containing protein [Leptospira sp.]|nr:UvrD-helicase domain-containing protein [Leptospira sp.]
MWSEEQLQIILSKDKIIQVIAGAGSGKTATMVGLLAEREKNPEFKPNETLVITFTKKATKEFKDRCIKKNLSKDYHISTFHAFCFSILKKHHPSYQSNQLKLLPEQIKWRETKSFFYPHRFTIGGIPFPILLKNKGSELKKISEDLYVQYSYFIKNYKVKNSYFELEDILEDFKEWLLKNSDFLNVFRKEIKSIIVDEFQDTDPVQLEILKIINPSSLVVVGDDWQAIYGFRGADPWPFLNFETYFPQVKKFHLSTNYRSVKEIILHSQIPIRRNKFQIKKTIQCYKKEVGVFQVFMLSKENKNLREYYDTLPLDTTVLVRTNFRKHVWKSFGISEDKISTIHSAKGLEFPSVLVDLTAGWGKIKDVDIEEERRILYVALSRAESTLSVLVPESSKDGEISKEFASYFKKREFLPNLALRLFPF